MKLHSFHRQVFMAKAHDDAGSVGFMGLRADLEFLRQVFFGDDQRVIPSSRHGMRNVAKDGLAVMLNLADLAVHDLSSPYDVTSEGRADGLVSQANPKNRGLSRKMPYQVNADA